MDIEESTGNDSSTLALFKKGHNQSSSFSDTDSDSNLDNLFAPDHPIRVNLPEDCLKELMKSPLALMEKEIIENYDIFLNCIFWQVKGLKGRSATRNSAINIRTEYYKYSNSTYIPPKSGVGITSEQMKNLDTVSDHDNDMVWTELEGYKPTRSNLLVEDLVAEKAGNGGNKKYKKKNYACAQTFFEDTTEECHWTVFFKTAIGTNI